MGVLVDGYIRSMPQSRVTTDCIVLSSLVALFRSIGMHVLVSTGAPVWVLGIYYVPIFPVLCLSDEYG